MEALGSMLGHTATRLMGGIWLTTKNPGSALNIIIMRCGVNIYIRANEGRTFLSYNNNYSMKAVGL